MPWRQLVLPAIIIGMAAFLIELTDEPWQTGLTAAGGAIVVLWLWNRTGGP